MKRLMMTNKKKQLIWLSYDLGTGGDYDSLYYWLDAHKARECGESVAALVFNYSSDLVSALKKSLKEGVTLRKKDRIYIVYIAANGGLKGQFIFGGRKLAPWKGYAEIEEQGLEDVG